MGLRWLRNLLMLGGAYWLAEWLATLMTMIVAASGAEYSGVGRLGEIWINIRQAMPRAVAAATGTALLWLTLGTADARRWMWGLAALFAVFGLMNHTLYPAPGVTLDPVSQAIDVGVYALLPAIGCVAAVWLLGRFGPVSDDPSPAIPSGSVSSHGRSRALLVAAGVLIFLVGASVGMWITTAVQIQQMSGWMVAAVDLSRRSQYAFTQYQEADYDEAKIALEQFAAHLESLKPASPEWQPGEAPLTDERGLAFDKMLTYGRLAIRAERAGRVDDAATYWERAETFARTLEWEQPTRDRIRTTVTRLDIDQPRNRTQPSPQVTSPP